MKKIKLLDCTLRDGGSINPLVFSEDDFINIADFLDMASIDFIELGFLNNTSDNYRFIKYCNKLIEINPKIKSKSVVMIDCSKLETLDKNIQNNNFSRVRIMFKKPQLNKALNFCRKLKESGYNIIVNPVSVTEYTRQDILNLINELNDILPETAYIIDTYGLMDKKETLYYFNIFNNNLNKEIQIGYHAHNNRQLAFSNAIEIINKNTFRDIIIDASLFGMGKRAGNIPTELIAEYLNEKFKSNYKLESILEVIQNIIIPINEHYKWGYSLTHYIAAVNKCHSDYVSYLITEKHLPISKINKILNIIEEDKKLCFDKTYTDKLIKKET